MKVMKTVVLTVAAVLMIGVLFAGAASAASASVWVWNVSSGDYDQLNMVGDSVAGTSGTAKITEIDENTGKCTLELDGFKVEGVENNIINIDGITDLTLTLKGESKLESVNSAAIYLYAFCDLTIKNGQNSGQATLRVTEKEVVPPVLGGSNSEPTSVIDVDGNLTISDVKVYVKGDDAYGIRSSMNIIINDGSYVEAELDSANAKGAIVIMPQYLTNEIAGNIEIDSATVKATVVSSGSDESHGLRAESGDIIIKNHAQVTATATSDEDKAFSIRSSGTLRIEKSTVQATAKSLRSVAFGLYGKGEELGIDISESHVRADVVSNYTQSPESVNAEDMAETAGIITPDGMISIDKSDVTITVKEEGSALAAGINSRSFVRTLEQSYTKKSSNRDTKISSSTVDVTVTAKKSELAVGIVAVASGSVKIDGDGTKIETTVVAADNGCGCGIMAYKSLEIDDCAEISAKGSSFSFAHGDGSLKIEKLKDTHVFAGAKAGDKDRSSITYDDFVKEWKQEEPMGGGITFNVSKYIDVLISKVSIVTLEGISEPIKIVYGSSMVENMPIPTKAGYTFDGWCTGDETSNAHEVVINADGTFNPNVPGYTDADGCWIRTVETTLYAHWTKAASNRGHSASIPKDYTPSSSVPVMVQETAKPTTTPTVAAPTAMPTTKPTTQATQKSPAPLAGLVAGLGAAALVLMRMRR